jgi:TonB family protein
VEDRVAEVLAQRAAIERGPAAGIVFSILLHGGITALAVYAALHAKPPQMASMLTIHLTPMTPASAAPAAKPAAKPVIHEPVPKVETPKPVTETAPAPKNTAPPSAFGKSPKKAGIVPAPPPSPAAAAASTTATTTGDIAPGTSGVTALEGGDFPYTMYIDNMKRLIGTHWFRPQIAGAAATTLYFAIDRDGTIRDAKVESGSGNGTFDRAALRAILESSPLPPLPFGYNGTYLGVHLTFK